MRRIIDRAHDLARKLISENRPKLDHLAKTLLEIETLEGDALLALMAAPVPEAGETPSVEASPPPAATPPAPPSEPERREEEKPKGRPRPGLAWGG